jgi:magnesium and cobalt transporter
MSKKDPKQPFFNRLKLFFSAKLRSHEQLIWFLRNAEAHNVIDSDALSMMEGVIQVSEMQARDIMIPRAQMATISTDTDFNTIMKKIIESGHSRFPVEGEHQDEILGILLAKDVLNNNESSFDLNTLLRPAIFAPESKRLNALLKEFKQTHNHMAIVADEYGGIAGLATIEDVLEQIVGDIEDEYDLDEENYIKKHSDKEYIIKATTPIETFNEYFKTSYSDKDIDTVAGLVNQHFDYLPKRNESVTIDKLTFTVLRADRRRIHLLSLKKK